MTSGGGPRISLISDPETIDEIARVRRRLVYLSRTRLTSPVPKISSAEVGAAIRFQRKPHELVVLRRPARYGVMTRCAASTGAYLSVTNVFALMRLRPASGRDKDVEILALRHQITVLERQLGKTRPRLLPSD